jgi:hypothetical protein
MGYLSTFRGAVTIDPPLNHAEIRASGVDVGRDEWPDLRLKIAETFEETPDGVLSRRTANALIPGCEDDVTGYDFAGSLAAAVSRLSDAHTLNGQFTREGADQGDVERWVVTDGRIHNEKARLVWPDGSQVGL